MTDSCIQLGPFKLDNIIGRGGMGDIWKGVHRAQRVPVAVKVLTEEGARRDDYLRQFRNEIRSVAGLDHPGVVLVFDHGEIDQAAAEASGGGLVAGSPYLVMEYARHGSLDRYVGKMNWPVVRHIVFNVLDALAHAHARGVVHRDLKPQNILLGCARTDGLGLKIADFGLAHPLDLAGRTGKYEQGWGTPHYMAPEQFRGKFRDYGPPTDLYALGIVVWQLTTGALPFDGANILEISGKHLHGDLPDYEPRFNVADGVKAWMSRLLQTNFRDRFQTAADAAYALARIVGDGHGRPDSSEQSGRILAGQHAPTVPMQASDHGTFPIAAGLGDMVSEPGIDTIHEHAATTLLLEAYQERDTAMPSTEVTLDVAAWMVEPFDKPGSRAKDLLHSEADALADIEPAPIPDDWRQPELGEPSPQLMGAGLGLFGLRTVRMVDRDQERDLMWEALEEVHRCHQARLVLLQGRTGTGKSRLAQWVCERASEVGAGIVLSAFHSPISGPADGLSGMVARHFGCVGLERDDVERRLERELRASGATEPYEWNALAEFVSPAPGFADAALESGGSRVRLTSHRQRYALLRRMVERIARDRPVILWLDDVQWGTDALGFAEHMLDQQRSIRSPIFLVLTARSEALNNRPLERSLVKRVMRSEHSAMHLLRPLEKKDTSELVRRLLMLDGDLAEQVESRSAGNPLFAVQLVDDWVSTGKLGVGEAGFCLSQGQTASIPDNIHMLWQDRINQLVAMRSESARVALELAAALGQEVVRDEWLLGCELVGACPQPDLEDALLGRALARSIKGGSLRGGWRFVHGMLRESLERLSREAGRWENLNSVCADVLEESYGAERATQQRRAHYLLEAGRLTDTVSPLLEAAKFQAERSDFGPAHESLDTRGDILAEIGVDQSARKWGTGWVLRSEVFELEANYTQALTWANVAVKHARDHAWPDLLSPSLRAAGGAHLSRGDFDRAKACFEEAGEISRDSPNHQDRHELALSLLGLGRVAQARAEFETANRLLEEAATILSERHDGPGLARCYNALGDIARQTRKVSQARHYADMARELFDEAGNQVGVADCLNDLSELNHLLGDVDRAEELCAQAIHRYEAAGSLQSMRVRLNLAFILLYRGEFDQAREVLARSREHFEREAQLAELAHCDVLLLACAAFNDDWNAWDELSEEAERLREQTGLRAPRIARAATIAAEVAEEHGQAERAATARALSDRFSG
jgi:serine/threonine protein kinase/tetratricopeptide (TPR) repeat protein